MGSVLGLLDDLKKQADAVRARDRVERGMRVENVQAVERTMRIAFRYLHDLLEQLKAIKPVNPVIYRLPGVGEFRDLVMADSFVSSRAHLVQDKEHLQRIDFLIVWSLSGDLIIERDIPPAVAKARELLWRSGFKFDETEIRYKSGIVAKTRFAIPQTIRMSVLLRADYEERRIVALAKNVLHLGSDEFAVPADEFTESVLEELALMLTGQPSAFRRYRIVLPPDSPFMKP